MGIKKYQIIYADPPWKQLKGGLRKVRPNQDRYLDYETLTVDEIVKILTHFNSDILFLWTIDKHLWDAEIIAERLGYKLHARIIWNKTNGIAPAFTVRYSHEYLLWFYKGKFIPVVEDQRGKWTTVLTETSTVHSKKPVIAYEFIESLYPKLKRIELFARNKRNGWDSWGNEVQSDIEL
jgi:N6-adenosine-specific RNA methylase IME4